MSAYLNARVSLLRARLWQRSDFLHLLDAGEDDVAAVLSEHGLPQLARGYTGQEGLSLEQRVIACVLDETRVLLRPLEGASRAFLFYWTQRFEISNLKTLLRGKMTGERPAALLARLTPMGSFARLDGEALAHTEDLPELFRTLEVGSYAAIARQARLAFEESHDPFLLDAALDRAYYEGLARHAKALEVEQGADFARLMGSYIDRINLVWLLRYRFNYHLPPAQVFYLLVNAHYGLSLSLLKTLAAKADIAAVLSALPEALHARLAEATEISEVARRMEQRRLLLAENILRKSGQSFTRAFAYLMLRERRLRDVRAILRGRQLRLPLSAIAHVAGVA